MLKEERYYSEGKPSECPACGKERVVPILYGLPGAEAIERERQGKVVLGGCCITGHDPSWQCLDCQTYVYRDKIREGGIEPW